MKRKTAEYLMYAEELHNQYLDSSGGDSDRWRQLQVPRHVARLRAGLAELANFKVRLAPAPVAFVHVVELSLGTCTL